MIGCCSSRSAPPAVPARGAAVWLLYLPLVALPACHLVFPYSSASRDAAGDGSQVSESAPRTEREQQDLAVSCSSTKAGDPCLAPNGSTGHCDNSGTCCTGCLASGLCKEGTSISQCGGSGDKCTSCILSNTCQIGRCEDHACTKTPKKDLSECTVSSVSGRCLGGECCTGCIDGTAGCMELSAQTAASCGKGGADCASCVDNKKCTKDKCESGVCLNAAVTCSNKCRKCDPASGACDLWVADRTLCGGSTSTTPNECCQGSCCGSSGFPYCCNKSCSDAPSCITSHDANVIYSDAGPPDYGVFPPDTGTHKDSALAPDKSPPKYDGNVSSKDKGPTTNDQVPVTSQGDPGP